MRSSPSTTTAWTRRNLSVAILKPGFVVLTNASGVFESWLRRPCSAPLTLANERSTHSGNGTSVVAVLASASVKVSLPRGKEVNILPSLLTATPCQWCDISAS